MSSPSRAFLYGLSILFLVTLAIFLFRAPAFAALVAGLLWLFVFVTAVAWSAEIAAGYAIVSTLLLAAATAQAKGWDQAWLLAHIPLVWCAVGLMQGWKKREEHLRGAVSDGLASQQKNLQNLHKEREALLKRLDELDAQARLRQALSDAVQQFASVTDPVRVRQRLMEFVKEAVGKGTIQFFGGTAPRDPLDRWVMERRLSLLVTDVSLDGRFKGMPPSSEVRSVLAAPVIVEKQWVGLLRVNGFEPNLFNVPDLRVVESLTLMASLALGNLQLLHRLKEGAVRDHLTGLYTHRFFEERLQEELLSAGRFQTSFAMLLLDIDHFKRYNDTYGHSAGDEVLVRFSRVLESLARPVDVVARYGGEEFSLILPQTSVEQARYLAEQIRHAIEQETFQFGSGSYAQERVTVSIGLSIFPQEATTASQLVRVADTRLYQAKQGGRNQVVG